MTIDDLDTEIARFDAERRAVERLPPTIAERFAALSAALRDAENV